MVATPEQCEIRVGQTLSQLALSWRWRRSRAWIRTQGKLVTYLGETWERMENYRKRCVGYRLVVPVRAIES